MKYGDGSGKGVCTTFAYSTYESQEGVLRHVESELQKAGVPVEFVDVEPTRTDPDGIRWSFTLDGKERS